MGILHRRVAAPAAAALPSDEGQRQRRGFWKARPNVMPSLVLLPAGVARERLLEEIRAFDAKSLRPLSVGSGSAFDALLAPRVAQLTPREIERLLNELYFDD